MNLKPGDVSPDGTQYVIDESDLVDTMALEMETQLGILYQKLKNTGLPNQGKDERLLLFLAIARGISQHIISKPGAVETAVDTHTHTHKHDLTDIHATETDEDEDIHTHKHVVTFNITM